MSTPTIRILAAALVMAAAATLARSEPPPAPPRAPVIQTVLDCRKIADSAARLACYDKAADGVVQAETSGDLVTVDREQRRALRKQAFGFNLPTLNLFDRGEKPDEANRITAKVASAAQDGAGHWIIRLEDGAVWAQTDDTVLYPYPHAGSTAVIRKGAIGSFFIDIDGRTHFRAARRS